MSSTQALWHIDASHSELRETQLAGEGIHVMAISSLISTGTERLVASGLVPESIHEQMRVPYQQGSFHFPLTYGYSLVGKVQQSGHPLDGHLVHLLHPHQSHCLVREEDLSIVPEGIPAARASLASNMETAVNAVWDSWASVGDRVLVVGFGLIGALVSELLYRIPGVDLWVSEPNPYRQQLAYSLGFQVLDGMPGEFDLAIHCSATESGINQAIEAVGKESRILELSWYGSRSPALSLGGTFHSSRKQIRSSQVSSLPADRLARWDFQRRKQLVFHLLKDPRFDEFLTHDISFKSAPDFYNNLRKEPPHGLAWSISYSV